MALIFFSCEFGEMLSDEFSRVNDLFYECNWHLLSAQVQRVFKMILADTQQPVIIKGYGNVSCLRETFKKVGDTVFNFLMQNRINVSDFKNIILTILGNADKLLLFHGTSTV